MWSGDLYHFFVLESHPPPHLPVEPYYAELNLRNVNSLKKRKENEIFYTCQINAGGDASIGIVKRYRREIGGKGAVNGAGSYQLNDY